MIENFWIGIIVLINLCLLLLLMGSFYFYCYNSFSDHEYTVWLRRGCVRQRGFAQRGFVLPLIDSIVLIPSHLETVTFEVSIQYLTNKLVQDYLVHGEMTWHVKDYETAYRLLSWDPTRDDYAPSIINAQTAAIIRDHITNRSLVELKSIKEKLNESLLEQLQMKFLQWGLSITSFNIQTISYA